MIKQTMDPLMRYNVASKDCLKIMQWHEKMSMCNNKLKRQNKKS